VAPGARDRIVASRPGARILELGTGTGVALGWIVHGLGHRDDATVLSVDSDSAVLESTREDAWPPWVELICADGIHIVEERGPFDLIFADAPAGKIDGLDATIRSLAPGATLVVDDMDPTLHESDGLLGALTAVRDTLVSDQRLIAVEIAFSTHVILAVKRTPD